MGSQQGYGHFMASFSRCIVVVVVVVVASDNATEFYVLKHYHFLLGSKSSRFFT